MQRITEQHDQEAGTRQSAGLLVVRQGESGWEVLIGHMGGPFWTRKTAAAWSIPKGELEAGEDPLTAALREFQEETGLTPPPPPYRPLGTVTQRSGKTVHAFVVEADLSIEAFAPGTCTIRWRGRDLEIPELDRIAWVGVEKARSLLVAAQVELLARLQDGAD